MTGRPSSNINGICSPVNGIMPIHKGLPMKVKGFKWCTNQGQCGPKRHIASPIKFPQGKICISGH